MQRDSLIAAVPRTDTLPAFKVDTRELLRRLPLHIMACVLAQEPCKDGAANTCPARCHNMQQHLLSSLVSLLQIHQALQRL